MPTIGPASESVENLRKLVLAGMDVARVNFSHGDVKKNVEVIERIKAVSKELGRPIAILQDLCGPKIRTRLMKGDEAILVEGEKTIVTTDDIEGTAERFSRIYSALPGDVSPGARILLDDGKMELRVDSVKELGRPLHDPARRRVEIEEGHESPRHRACRLRR